MMIQVHTIVNGKWDENCYVVSTDSRHAIIIDPGSDAERIAEYVHRRELKVLAIMNTHAHYDHMGAVYALKEQYHVPFYLHTKEMKTLKHVNLYRALLGAKSLMTIPGVDVEMSDADIRVCLEDIAVQIHQTPGHTPGGVCFQIGEHLFTGDTLFHGSIGRTDLPGCNKEALNASLRCLSRLDHRLKIYPGHGAASTLANEIKTNPYVIKALNNAD